jgi:histidyl-tRNA synthetase
MFDTWTRVAERFGYERYDAPILEPIEVYAAKSGQEIVSEQTYTFTDRGERTVAIRPEMTPSVARMVAARRQEMAMPARLYSIANFMRYERPQRGREREFWQLNIDLFGVNGVSADIEIISLSAAIVEAFGATPDMFTIRVNDRRLTDFIMREYLGLDEVRATDMIRLFDRRAKMSAQEFNSTAAALFGEVESDDGLSKITKLLAVKNLDDLPDLIKNSDVLSDLQQLLTALAAAGLTNVQFDVSLMRGFDYYTGIVFEVFDEAPVNRRAMFGGGRYDGLVGLFGVADLPVVGVAPGETTFAEFLRAHNLVPKLQPATQVVIIPVGEVDVTNVADELRTGGLNVAVDFTNRKVDKKIKAAAKMSVPYALFVGENEIVSKNYTIKNLASQSEEKLPITDIKSYISSTRN